MLGFARVPEPRFEERAPHEVGFAETFRQHVVPKLGQLESDRRRTIVAMIGIFGLCAIFVGLAFDQGWALAAKLAIGGAFTLPWIPAAMFWAQEEAQIMSAVCRHFPGLACAVNVRIPEERLQPYRQLDLLPPPESPSAFAVFSKLIEQVDLEEELTGRHRDIPFWLGEGEILEKQGSNEQRLFYGTLIEVVLPVRDDVVYTMTNDAPRGGRPMLSIATDAVRTSLETLGQKLGSTSMKADVLNGIVYVAMPHLLRARPFSVGGISQSAYLCEPMIRTTLDQLAQLHAVVDALANACAAPAPVARAGA
jgi:hypothetical protein